MRRVVSKRLRREAIASTKPMRQALVHLASGQVAYHPDSPMGRYMAAKRAYVRGVR